ncbi:hypothetical protein [Zooshikella ganghwensis]|uniref:hypothetical protein n=1 Tax=Zooshikella ganghwensis TaxID=202772 RepID=UPI0004152EF7|nr:hypothetical protein [Zooshikella ganghwensis]
MKKQQIHSQHMTNLDQEYAKVYEKINDLGFKIVEAKRQGENGLALRLANRMRELEAGLKQHKRGPKQQFHKYLGQRRPLNKKAVEAFNAKIKELNQKAYDDTHIQAFLAKNKTIRRKDLLEALERFRIAAQNMKSAARIIQRSLDEAKTLQRKMLVSVSDRYDTKFLRNERIITNWTERQDKYQQDAKEYWLLAQSFYQQFPELQDDCSDCLITEQDIADYTWVRSISVPDFDQPDEAVTPYVSMNKGFYLRLVYADDPSEPVRNGSFFHWLYDADNNQQLNLQSATDKEWNYTALQVSCTDENGYVMGGENYIPGNRTLGINLASQQLSVKPELDFSLVEPSLISRSTLNVSNTLWPMVSNGELRGATFSAAQAVAIESPDNSDKQAAASFISIDNQVFADILSYNNNRKQAKQLVEQLSQIEEITSGERYSATQDIEEKPFSMTFRADRPYGLMLYPVNRGPFVTQPVDQYITMSPPTHEGPQKAEQVAWKGKPEAEWTEGEQLVFQDYYRYKTATLKLHCTLPEWDRRLCIAIDDIVELQKAQQEEIAPYFAAQSTLQQMAELSQYHYLFRDYSHPDSVAAEAHLLKTHQAISKLAAFVKEQTSFLNQTTTLSYRLKETNQKLHIKAEKLYTLLCSPAFQAELKLYMDHAKQGKPGGPYMQAEPFWIHIFDTISKAYDVLAATHLGQTIGEREIPIVMEGVAGHRDLAKYLTERSFFDPDENAERPPHQFKFKNKTYTSKLTSYFKRVTVDKLSQVDADNSNTKFEQDAQENQGKIGPLSLMLDYCGEASGSFYDFYKETGKDFLNSWVNNIPGPPPVLMVALDTYAAYVNLHLYKHLDKSSTFHVRFLLSISNIGGFLTQSRTHQVNRKSLKALHLTMIMRSGKQFSEGVITSLFGKELKGSFQGLPKGKQPDQGFADLLSNNIQKTTTFKVYRGTLNILNTSIAVENLCDFYATVEKDFRDADAQDNLIHFFLEASLNHISLIDNVVKNIKFSLSLLKISDFNEGLTKILNGFATLTMLLGVIVSAMDLAYHWEERSGKENLVASISLASSFAYLLGFAFKESLFLATSKFLGVTLGTLSTPLIVIGTILFVSTLLIMHGDDLWEMWTQSGSYKALIKLWTNVNKLDSFKELTGQGSFRALEGAENANKLMQAADALLKDDQYWGRLNWRAIIPLHRAGFNHAQIENMVAIPLSGRKVSTRQSIAERPMSASGIILYYKALKAEAERNPNRRFQSGRSCSDITYLLENAAFIPDRDYPEDLHNAYGGLGRQSWGYEYFYHDFEYNR